MRALVKDIFFVSRVFGAYYEIYSQETGPVRAVLRGKLRLGDKTEKHPIVVGDLVRVEKGLENYSILERLERKTILFRKSGEEQAQALCANAEQVLILASLKDPETKTGFVDRCLTAVSISGMKPIIVFTKRDLVSSEFAEEKMQFYSELGYSTDSVSLEDSNSIERIQKQISGKVSFLCGNSGVGKSSLLNALAGFAVQSTKAISQSTSKGKHTTTNSFAIFLQNETVLIDSPGIKEFGILHLTKEEIQDAFPEIRKLKEACTNKFCCDESKNCPIQWNESIREERWKSYVSELESFNQSFRTSRRDHLKR